MRLTGGTVNSGRLEIFHANTWGTVCDDILNDFVPNPQGVHGINVACRQLGYAAGTPRPSQGRSTIPLWLDEVTCTGNETRLEDCLHNGWGFHNCSVNESVIISCTAGSTAEATSNFSSSVLTAQGNAYPISIWSDSTTMWVLDPDDRRIYAYDLDTMAYDSTLSFTTPLAGQRPLALWSNGSTLWVADATDDKIYAYGLFSKQRIPSEDFDALIDAGNLRARGLWSDDITMWVSDDEDDKIYAYNVASKERDVNKDIPLDAGNTNPHGLWSDGTTLWVADESNIFAYSLRIGTRDIAREIGDLPTGGQALGLWSNGSTLWVSDNQLMAIFAYTLPTPNLPAELAAPTTVADDNRIDISWTPVQDATVYRVYRSTSSRPNSVGSQIYEGNQQSYTDSGTNENTVYYYRWTACVSTLPSSCSPLSHASTIIR